MSNNGGSKKLYRSRKNRIIAGVLGGLAEYLQVDVVLLRIVYLLLMFFGNFTFLPFFTYRLGDHTRAAQSFSHIGRYLSGRLCGDVYSSYSDVSGSSSAETGEQHVSGKVVLGAILLVIGAVILFKNFLPTPSSVFRVG